MNRAFFCIFVLSSPLESFYVFTRFLRVFLPIKVRYRPRVCLCVYLRWRNMREEGEDMLNRAFFVFSCSRVFTFLRVFFTFFTYKSTISSSCVYLRWRNRIWEKKEKTCWIVHFFLYFRALKYDIVLVFVCIWGEETEYERRRRRHAESCFFLYFPALLSTRKVTQSIVTGSTIGRWRDKTRCWESSQERHFAVKG